MVAVHTASLFDCLLFNPEALASSPTKLAPEDSIQVDLVLPGPPDSTVATLHLLVHGLSTFPLPSKFSECHLGEARVLGLQMQSHYSRDLFVLQCWEWNLQPRP